MDATATHAAPKESANRRNDVPTQGAADLRRAFGCLPSGVAAVCADIEPHPTGMLVSSLTSVSLEPPLLSFCVQNGSRTWAGLQSATHVGVSFLGDTHEQVCVQFGGESSQRLARIPVRRTAEGAVLLEDAAATFVCSLYEEFSAGDHTIVVLRIETFEAAPECAPLVFHRSRYRTLAG
jgi:flavin reductase (DIM6/NTAB) family NADH-FMN oxidoreductase RutF